MSEAIATAAQPAKKKRDYSMKGYFIAFSRKAFGEFYVYRIEDTRHYAKIRKVLDERVGYLVEPNIPAFSRLLELVSNEALDSIAQRAVVSLEWNWENDVVIVNLKKDSKYVSRAFVLDACAIRVGTTNYQTTFMSNAPYGVMRKNVRD